MPDRFDYPRRVYAATQMTAEELLRLTTPNARTELVDGVLVVREPAGFHHGRVAARLLVAIGTYVTANNLGVVVAAETGFKLFSQPDTVRAPDVGFISRAREPHPETRGFPQLAPDLVVEVLSPDDRPLAVREKIADWLEAGARLVWVVDPIGRAAHVHRADATELVINERGVLDGEGVLPGFSLELARVL